METATILISTLFPSSPGGGAASSPSTHIILINLFLLPGFCLLLLSLLIHCTNEISRNINNVYDEFPDLIPWLLQRMNEFMNTPVFILSTSLVFVSANTSNKANKSGGRANEGTKRITSLLWLKKVENKNKI